MPAGEYKVEASFDLGPYQDTLAASATISIDPKAIAKEVGPPGEAALKAHLQELRNAIALFQAMCGCYPQKLEDLMATEAPEKGVKSGGGEVEINATDFQGPYITTPDGKLPRDPISGEKDWRYDPKTGAVYSNAKGRTANGKRYREL